MSTEQGPALAAFTYHLIDGERRLADPVAAHYGVTCPSLVAPAPVAAAGEIGTQDTLDIPPRGTPSADHDD
jgi:hypothetical protein